MIDFASLIPTLEQTLHGSVAFAALSHGIDIVIKRYKQWKSERKWAAEDAEWKKMIAESKPVEAVKELAAEIKDDVKEVVETVKSKAKKNG